MAARMQPAMPRYARGEKATGAVWAGDAPLPRHCSASVVCDPWLSFANPATAMQADWAGQATEKLFMSPAPGRGGVGWMRHRAPFHRSARVCGGKPAGAPKASPVAVQADSEVQDTLPMPAPCVPGGVGVGSTLQVVPLSRSASVPAFVAPVAMQAVADWHQTLPRKPPGVFLVGMGWTCQLLPFHRSANVPVKLEASPEAPTAMQADEVGHATPLKVLFGWFDGPGAGTTRQAWPSQCSATTTCAPIPVEFE